MSNVHIRTIDDADGNLVDMEYFHHYCALYTPMGEYPLAWPAPEAVDYPVYCAWCGDRMIAVPLTEYGAAEDFSLARGNMETVRND